MQIENLFPSPIFTFDELIPEDVNNEIIEHLNVLKKIDNRSYSQNWHSDNSLFERPPYCLQVLKEKIESAFMEVEQYWFQKTNDDTFDSELEDPKKGEQTKVMWGWAVIQNQGDYTPPHVHPDSTFSAVYFCQVPELETPNGCLEFNNPVPGAAQGIPFRYVERKIIKPVERSLLFFPSYLSHWVHPMRDEISEPRISVGVDIKIKTDYLNGG